MADARPKAAPRAKVPAKIEKKSEPVSRRGKRTRAQLVAAARAVFERDGYLDARLSDISAEAGVSAGTFYTYFESKEEVFAAVVAAVQEDMVHPHMRERVGEDDLYTLIEAANREYLTTYKSNARLMAVFEQVAQIDADFQQLRWERSKAFVNRNARMVRKLKKEGRLDPELDPRIVAHALSVMTGRMAHQVFVLGEPIPLETLVFNITRIWAKTLGLDPPAKADGKRPKTRKSS